MKYETFRIISLLICQRLSLDQISWLHVIMGYIPNFAIEVTEKKKIWYGCCHRLGQCMAQKHLGCAGVNDWKSFAFALLLSTTVVIHHNKIMSSYSLSGPHEFPGYFKNCSVCEQNCINAGYYYIGGIHRIELFLCVCGKGFILNRDKRTCRGITFVLREELSL